MATTTYKYPLDLGGLAATNKVNPAERQTLNPPAEALDYHFVLTKAGPYYRDSMVVKHIPTGRTLIRGVDWFPGHKFHTASYETEGVRGGIYQSVLFADRTLSGQIDLGQYQVLGGEWSLDENRLLEILSNRALDPRYTTYEQVSGKPTVFPPIDHAHDGADLTGLGDVVTANLAIAAAIRQRTQTWLDNPPIIMAEYPTWDDLEARLDGVGTGGGASLEELEELVDSMTKSYTTATAALVAVP